MSNATYTFTIRKSNPNFKPEIPAQKAKRIRKARRGIESAMENRALRATAAEVWQ